MSEFENSIHNSELSKNVLLDAETIWKQNENIIIKGMESILQLREMDDEEKTEATEKFMKNEKAFIEQITAVFNTILQQKKYKEIQILWDVDDTLAKNIFIDQNTFITKIRPMAPILMKLTQEAGRDGNLSLRHGLLTNRSELKGQLENKERLEELAPYINENLLYSDREIKEPYFRDEQEKLTYYQERLQNITATTTANKLLKIEDNFYPGDRNKLIVLSKIKEKLPNDTAILAIDDFKYPTLLDPKKDMYGVSLKNDGRFAF